MTKDSTRTRADESWLTRYYLTRATVSAAWVGLAFTAGRSFPLLGIALLILYPAWDCLANLYDARRNGGLAANPPQALNTAASALVTAAVAATAPTDVHTAIGVIGVWATLSGLLQLLTAIRRWRGAAAQWPMILSGAQSALAGTHFLMRAADKGASLDVAAVAPYAAFGAVYFALSGALLIIRVMRRPAPDRGPLGSW